MTIVGLPVFSRAVRTIALIAGSLSLGACTTVETQSFVVKKGGRVESSQIAVGADFSKYDRLQAADMGIFFPSGTEMRTEDEQRLRKSFRDAFIGELEGYSISREPGPTTMKVEASLIDLRGPAGAGSARRALPAHPDHRLRGAFRRRCALR